MTWMLQIDSDRHRTLCHDVGETHGLNETAENIIEISFVRKQYLFYRGLVHQKMEVWISEPFLYLLFL